MKLRILPSALTDLTRGRMFYARLDPGLGEYFLDSIFGDINPPRFMKDGYVLPTLLKAG